MVGSPDCKSEFELSSARPHGSERQDDSDVAGSGSVGAASVGGGSALPASSPNIMARIDRRASGFRPASGSGSDPRTPAVSASGASAEGSGAKPPVSGASATLCGSSDSVAASTSAGCSSVGAPNGKESDSSSFARTSFGGAVVSAAAAARSEEHTSELQSQSNLVCRLLLEKKNK